MAKSRILKKQNKAYLELPQEMLEYDEAELSVLKEGLYLLRLPERKRVSEVEIAVLRKLNSIRFEKRTPAYVEKALTEAERLVLKELERKGLVNVFKGKKDRDGVDNIRDSVYPLLKGKNETVKQEEPRKQPDPPGLLGRGFLTLNDKNEAFRLSQQLKQEMRKGDVIGVKGFDGKFYVVTRQYLQKSQAAISSILKEGMDVHSIASAARMDAEGCAAVLRLMAENGDVLEKKKGVFAPV